MTGSVILDANPKLTGVAGLRNLTSITGGLSITDHAAMTSLAGLDALTSVLGTLVVTGNDAIPRAEVAAFLARLHPAG